jgi:hypothetical protein
VNENPDRFRIFRNAHLGSLRAFTKIAVFPNGNLKS